MTMKDSVLDEIERMIVEPRSYDHKSMEELWVSNRGDDKNDGKTRETAIYSLKRLRQLRKNNTELKFVDDETRQRIIAKIEKKRKKASTEAQRPS